MVTVDSGSAGRQRRRTWVVGGALLVGSAMLRLAAQGPLFALASGVDLLFAAGALLLAIGIGRAGSVTARRPLGTGAVVALVVVLLGWPLVANLVTSDDEGFGDGQLIGRAFLVTLVQIVLLLAFAIVATVQIGRAGVVPRPWNWAPLWALVVVVLTRILPMLMPRGLYADPTGALMLSGALALLGTAAVAFLGIVAIVLGTRAGDNAVAVYPSSTS